MNWDRITGTLEAAQGLKGIARQQWDRLTVACVR